MSSERFSEALRTLDAMSLRRRPSPDEQITLGEALASAFADLPESEREAASLALAGSSAAKKLIGLSGYLAEAAINSRDAKQLTHALALHAIEAFRTDHRENVRHLALIAHAARKLGHSLDSVMRPMLHLASEETRRRLGEFAIADARRPNRLSSFGVREDETSGAFRFVPLDDPSRGRRR